MTDLGPNSIPRFMDPEDFERRFRPHGTRHNRATLPEYLAVLQAAERLQALLMRAETVAQVLQDQCAQLDIPVDNGMAQQIAEARHDLGVDDMIKRIDAECDEY